MRRAPPVALLAAVLLGAPALAQRVAEKPPALVPAYLPREVAFLTFFQNGNITPELRIAWHIPVVQQRIDSLNLIIEGGGGWAVGKRSVTNENADPPLTELHQWHILGGIAYEGDWAQGWHVGGRITAGVTIFGGTAMEQGPAPLFAERHRRLLGRPLLQLALGGRTNAETAWVDRMIAASEGRIGPGDFGVEVFSAARFEG
jgi:hypothetical protein